MIRRLTAGICMPALALAASVFAISTEAAADPVAVAQRTTAGQLVALQQMRDLVEKQPDRYAGVSTQGADRITVHLLNGRSATATADAAPFRRAADAAGINLSFDHRRYSLSELNRVNASIPVKGPFAAPGAGLSRWGVDPDTNSVEVGVVNLTPELVAEAEKAYGDKVTLIENPRLTEMSGRRTDTPAYYGGDMIDVAPPGGGYCSSGFTLTNAHGTRYAISAGHCAELGTRVETNNRSYFGTVHFRRYGGGALDAELIGGVSYDGRIWVGPPDTTTSLPVHAAQNSCVGCWVNFDGAFTGESPLQVVRGPFCAQNTIGVVSCGLWNAVHRGSYIGCQGGDSGGPVFAYNGRGGVTAVGIVKGGYSSTDCVYTSVPDILAMWQSTITTG